MMNASTYTTYSRVLRALRRRGVKLGFLELSAAAELALLLEEGQLERARELAERLDVDVDALGESVSE